MVIKIFAIGLVMAVSSFSATATEKIIELTGDKPGQKEFQVAAKRALFSRNYEIRSVNPDVVIGKYKKRVEVAIIRTQNSIIIRFIDSGGVKSETINSYSRNLERDLVYELAEYAIVPTTTADTSDRVIEDQPVIDQILNHLNRKGTWLTPMSLIPEGTGSPAAQPF